MVKNNLSDKVTQSFCDYLSQEGVSPLTLKNYRSDLTDFTGWLLLRIRSWGMMAEELTEAVPFLTKDLALEYRHFLAANNINTKTINRRLSTLRHLSRFFLLSQILDFDFTEGLANIPEERSQITPIHYLLSDFQKHLQAEKVSHNTIKNYLSDIKQFIFWVESHQPPVISH